jgi:hypothetical protein
MAFGKVTLPPESCNVVTWKMTLNHTMHLVHGNIFEELSVKNLDKLPICDLFATCSSIQDAGNSRECLIDLKNTREANNNLLDLLVVCAFWRSVFFRNRHQNLADTAHDCFGIRHEGSVRVSFEGTTMIH